MFNRSRSVPQLLSGLLFITISIAVLNTLVPLWMTRNILPTWQIGLVSSAYYTGNLIGALIAGLVIHHFGHIYGFIIAAFLFMCSSIGLMMTEHFYFWILCRFISGIGCALIWVVIESALLCVGSLRNRGQLLACYMVVYYSGTVIGQLLITILPTTLQSTIPWLVLLIIMSVLPILASRLIYTSEPACYSLPENSIWSMFCRRKARLGIIGCMISGAVLGSLYSLMPVYLANHGMNNAMIGYSMALLVCAGVIAQWPLAKLTDRVGRSLVLLMQMCLVILSAVAILNQSPVLPALFVLGCATFTLYPIAISWACESVMQHELVSMNQALLLSYTVGNLIGPTITSTLMQLYSDRQLFIVIASIAFIYMLMLLRNKDCDVSPAHV